MRSFGKVFGCVTMKSVEIQNNFLTPEGSLLPLEIPLAPTPCSHGSAFCLFKVVPCNVFQTLLNEIFRSSIHLRVAISGVPSSQNPK